MAGRGRGFRAFRAGPGRGARQPPWREGWGQPGFDRVLNFKMLVLGAMHGLSLQQINYLVRDRLSGILFCGLGGGISLRYKITDAAACDSAQLREGLIDPCSTTSDVGVDMACCSLTNESNLQRRGTLNQIHRKKRPAKPMPAAIARANAQKSKVGARVEHVFPHQKARIGRLVRAIDLARATAIIALVNIAYDVRRCCWLNAR